MKNNTTKGKMNQRLLRQIKPELYITLPATAGEIKHRDARALGLGLTELMINDKSGKTIARVICSAWEYNRAARMIKAYHAESVISLPNKF